MVIDHYLYTLLFLFALSSIVLNILTSTKNVKGEPQPLNQYLSLNRYIYEEPIISIKDIEIYDVDLKHGIYLRRMI